MEIAKVRELIQDELDNIILQREVPDVSGSCHCHFWANGCKRRFANKDAVKRHIADCFFGLMQYCKNQACNPGYGRMHRTPRTFANHAITVHECHETTGNSKADINLFFDSSVMKQGRRGYSLKVLESFDFNLEDDKVKVCLGAVLQDLGLQFNRVMMMPLVFSPDKEKMTHLIEMESRVYDQQGKNILPIGYPGFKINDRNAVLTSYGYKSTLDFVSDSDSIDGVVCYTSKDLGIDDETEDNNFVRVEVSFRGYRCIVKETAAFPIVPWVLDWSDLLLEPRVRETMSDGQLPRPSYISRILLLQIKGQCDVMINSADLEGSVNAVMGGMYDDILKSNPRKTNKTKNALAFILFPNVSAMMLHQDEWRQRGTTLGIDVLVFDNDFDCIKSFLKRFGSDVILTTPSLLCQLLKDQDPMMKTVLTKEIKFVYLHQYYEIWEEKANLDNCLANIPIKKNGVLKVAFMEYMTHDMLTQPENADADPTSHAAIFSRGWNLFTLGPDQERLIREMKEEVIPSPDLANTNQIIVDKIGGGVQKHWVILHTTGYEGISLLKLRVTKEFGHKQVVVVSEENEIFYNASFWDPWLERNNTTILIGPYFLLNFAEIQRCDGVIFFSPPPHASHRVRVSKFTTLPDNTRKPVISFG